MKKALTKMFSGFKEQCLVTRKVRILPILSLTLGVLILIAPVSSAFPKKAKVKVMTRNLYVGGDIFRVVEAVNDPDPLAIPIAVAGVFQTVQHTNFFERAEAIADEIQRYKPHLIGLQEVSTILMQEPGDFLVGNPAPAEVVVYDYIEILMDALAARKLKYEVAYTVTDADVELPMFVDFSGGVLTYNDLRLIDHDVILVRKGVTTWNPVAQNFLYNVGMDIGGVALEFTRGFVAVDAEVEGEVYRFVNTHLEIGGEPGSDFALVQALQMQELLTILSFESLPVILVGDFNSDPEDDVSVHPVYGEIVPPYMQAVAAGYTDIWTPRGKPAGLTCCFNEEADDPDAELYERIDHIFLLPQYALALEKAMAVTTGDKEIDMTSSGLWPSDHAGVIGRIKFSQVD
jgi:hypothetical protein